jgi:hypothetical protein
VKKRLQNPCCYLAVAFSLAFVLSLQLSGQTFTGDILGTVSDQTGAVVTGANVTLKSVDKSVVVREVTTSQDGTYLFSRVDPGRYEIDVTASGFDHFVATDVVLPVGTRVTVNIPLQVGQTTTRVEVNQAADLVKPDDIVLGQVIAHQEIAALPLNGRNFIQLAQLSPGVTQIGSADSPVTGWTGRTDLSIVVSGLRETDSSYLLDGIETRSPRWGSSGFRPSVDAIQEFNVQRNAFPADQGWGTTVVNTILRSGTDELHGSLFEFIRNGKLDARNYFDVGEKPPFKQNQFGGTLGGPIKKGKLFFFVDYEGFRQRISNTTRGTVPTPDMLQGKFLDKITDPTTGQPFAQDAQGFYVIPQQRIDPVIAKVIPFWPAPNNPDPLLNFVRAPNTMTDSDQVHGKVDYTLSPKDQLFAHYSWVREPRIEPTLFNGYGLSRPLGDQNTGIGSTHVVNSSMVNEFRIGYNRNRVFNTAEGAFGADLARQIGLQNTDTNPAKFSLPLFAPNGVSGIGQGFSQTQSTIDEIFQLNENLSYTHGRHTWKWGADIRYNRLLISNDFPSNPFFFFDGQYTGDSVADFMLGLPNLVVASKGDSTAHFRRTEWSVYAQDNFKITPKLNLYFGLRYEYPAPFTELNDKLGYFDLKTQTVKTVLKDHIRRSLFAPDRNNFAPRVGFAYSVTPHTVIRSGFGMFYDLVSANETQFYGVLMPPNFAVVNLENTHPTPSFSMANMLPPIDTVSIPAGFSPQTIIPTDRTPYVYMYNLNLEHQLKGVLLEAGYVGSTGIKLNRRFNQNLAPPDPNVPLENRRPFPAVTDILSSHNDGWSDYNGFNFKAEKPFSHGLTLLAAYTLGKHLDIGGPDEYVHNDVTGRLKNLKGPAQIDSRNRLVMSYLYELPFGKGKRFGGNVSGPLGTLASGWRLSGITTFASGQPRTPSDGGSNWGDIGNRRIDPAICLGPLNDSHLRNNIRNTPNMFPYFNVNNIEIPQRGTVGNCSRGSIVGPGINNWDLGVTKNTRVSDRINVEFRGELFNVWNHAQFDDVVVNFTDPNFGRIVSARPARDIQFGLKVNF